MLLSLLSLVIYFRSSILSQTAISSSQRRDRGSTSRHAPSSSRSFHHPSVHTIDSPGRPEATGNGSEVLSHRSGNNTPHASFHPHATTPRSFPHTPSDTASRSRHGRAAATGRSTRESSMGDATPFPTGSRGFLPACSV